MDRVLLVNQEPASPSGVGTRIPLGSLTTLRDLSGVQRLSGELESVRTLSDASRSQTHEYAHRLHTVVSVLELERTREAIELIAQETETIQSLADEMVGASSESALAAPLLGKVAQAGERGVKLRLAVEDEFGASALPTLELVSVVGNLVDNAIDAAAQDSAAAGSARGRVTVRLALDREAVIVELTVEDSGFGIDPDQVAHLFDRGFSTKLTNAAGRGFGTGGQAIRGPLATCRGRSIVIHTLVVEDDALTAEAHADYLGRHDGFELAGIARTAMAAGDCCPSTGLVGFDAEHS